MTEAHWFSNFCPLFSVFDLERFVSLSTNSSVTIENLKKIELFKAALWLERHLEGWSFHLRCVETALKQRDQNKFEILFWGDENFPAALKTIHFPPAVLFVRGDSRCLTGSAVSVVGARHPTDLGRLWVRETVKELASVKYTIVSGGARGIDGEAHFAALQESGKTVAFLPGGVDKPYPAANSYIFEKIEKSGALISEYMPGTSVRAENFHRRNRLIAGASPVVVIVEAALKSGTMMTALKAIAENREVLVVPGPPMVESYTGSLELLAQGAGLARNARDVIKSITEKNF